ncbi:MAG: hypothetical protein DRQ48_07435 [Gammaproteobacteria bacterium]|nr:MAG: hypothetical protein DRQ58_04925 [Gammaproteobacteria bacterium]RKZ69774.1 MAG: hypothetical protein DRQ48_07435 [Gammaproteobacteria bacterium]
MKNFHGLIPRVIEHIDEQLNNAGQVSLTNEERPPKPREPDISECCQRNCVNCVFVYYEKALVRWKKKVEEFEATKS